MTDESPIGIWLWVALIIGINITWISMDVWLHRHGHEYLTTEFREGLQNELWGPLVVGLMCFTIGAFVFHMFNAPKG
jgi:hypothetical protein